MAIEYEKIGWDTSKYINPTDMNHMDDGIKAACDGVDKNTQSIEALNSNLAVIGGVSVFAVPLSVAAEAGKETEYVLTDNIPNGTYIVSVLTHVDNAPIPEGSRLFATVANKAYIGATAIAGNSQTWQWAQTACFSGSDCSINFLPEFNFKATVSMNVFLIRLK